MKNFLIIIFLLVAFNGVNHAQTTPKFNLTKDGVKPVVLTFDAGLTADQIYTRVKEWFSNTLKNPQSAIRVDTKNTLIKIGIFKERAWKIRANNFDHWYDLEYTLTVEIKDAKCRVTFATPEDRYKVWYNVDGSTIAKFKESESTFESTINETLASLYSNIKGEKKVVKDDF